jgi:hypothetical protein
MRLLTPERVRAGLRRQSLLPPGDDDLAAGEAADPELFNLYTNPREEDDKVVLDSWIIGPVLKMVAAFEESAKQHPPIPMGTPDPYAPR